METQSAAENGKTTGPSVTTPEKSTAGPSVTTPEKSTTGPSDTTPEKSKRRNESGRTKRSLSVGGAVGKKSRKKVNLLNQLNNVSKATRDELTQVLEQFGTSNDEVYTFKDNLKRYERAAVHILAMNMGMTSKSFSHGMEHRVSVYKTKGKVSTVNKKENQFSFKFSQDAKGVLQNLFSCYPPDDAEMTTNEIGESSGKMDGFRANGNDMFSKPAITESEIADKLESLTSRIEKSPNLKQIAEARSMLPIASYRDVITSTIMSNQVVLICGETGCGKTTQVPQFLLDHSWSNGKTCKIVCSQPRRISAISVAERVASERGEDIGDSVGYKIRLESKGGRHSSLVFCTNGLLLKVLVSKGSKGRGKKKRKASSKMANSVSELTHIIVDEIHERDRFSDVMLAILREILPLYPHLRVVLMSATIDAERFSEYFGGCPIVRVPGKTYPVKSFYLEDVLSMVRSTERNRLTSSNPNDTKEEFVLTEEWTSALDEAIDLALSNDEFDSLLELMSSEGNPKILNYQHSTTGVTPVMVFAGKGRVGDICMLLSLGVDCSLQSVSGKTAFDYAKQDNQEEAAEIIRKHMEKTSNDTEEERNLIDKYLSNANPELIDYVLIEQLLRKICNDSKEGAILIFLPGWDHISRARDKLCASPFFKDESKFLILSLHSMVPSAEQKEVFKRPPLGCRKIVLSTNISETSVTIDDVVYVIDSGRMKQKSYDPVNNVSTLHCIWISKASAKQRAGRAGRCQPGTCYHLYSNLHAASLPDFQVPEIKRMPIEELCLQVKLIDPSCKIEDFLQKTLDPPCHLTIHNALTALKEIGALSLDENLTDLGEKLGSLPVHPRTSKMLFLAILLKCLDPALTLACASDYKDPFISPMLPDLKEQAAAAKMKLASFYGGIGDQLAVIAAFDCWRIAKAQGLGSKFCSEYFLSQSTMRMISGMRKNLESELVRYGFIQKDTRECNVNSGDPGILHLVLVACVYPKVGKLVPQGRRSIIETGKGIKVRLKPSSAIGKLSFEKCSPNPLVIFDEIIHGDGGLCIGKCSVVGSLPLLLLAKEIVVSPSSDAADDDPNSQNETVMSSAENSIKVVIESWLPFESTALDVAQIYCLRERLSAATLFKITHPREALPLYLTASLHAIACILSSDGMFGMSLPPMDSPATEASANMDHKNEKENTEANQLSIDCLKSLMKHGEPFDSMSQNQRASFPADEVINYNRLPVYAPPPIPTVVVNQPPRTVEPQSACFTAQRRAVNGRTLNTRKRKRMLPFVV